MVYRTYKQLKTFYKTRIVPEFSDGYYASLVDKAHEMSQEQMKIRNSTLIFRSSSKAGSLEGIDSDYFSLDEYDRIDSTAEQSALEAMSSSKYGFMRRWSTPTSPNYGIHKLYLESDKRRWEQKCEHCGKYQVLDYEANIKQTRSDGVDLIGKVILPGTFEFVCKYCGMPMDRWYGGRWNITDPSQGRTHGYSISQMDAVWISADKLKEKEMNSPSKQFFYNYTLGLPYEDKSAKFFSTDVTSNQVERRRLNYREDYQYIACGIDWGTYYHHLVTLGIGENGRIDVLDLYKVQTSKGVEHIEQDLNTLMRRIQAFNPNIILADVGFNGNYVDKLTARFGKGVVYGVNVRSAKSNGDYNAHFNEGSSTVTIDKLTQNMIMMSRMKRGDYTFYSPMDEDLDLFIKHWDNVIIRTDEDVDDNTHAIKLVKNILRKGDDHFAQASVYANVGITRLVDDINGGSNNELKASYLEETMFTQDPTDFLKRYR